VKLYIFTARRYASVVYAMGLCPSVSVCLCLSVTSRCSNKTVKLRIKQTTPLDSPGTLVIFVNVRPILIFNLVYYTTSKDRKMKEKLQM